MSAGIREIVAEIARPVVEEAGCEYIDTEYAKQGSDWMLTVFIDKQPDGVTIEDCEKVSRAVEAVLDREDPIEGSYTLVVSSPGLDRPLKTSADFERFMGDEVHVKLYKPFMGRKEFVGELLGGTPDAFTVRCGDDEITFEKDEVAKVNLHPSL